MVEQRAAGVPIEQVVGWAEFCGLRIGVDRGVFVPRRRTEFLAGQAIALVRPAGPAEAPPPVVVDLCCGSGAVGAAVACAAGPIDLHASDIDPVAAACARRNLAAVGGHVHQGDLFEALPASLRGYVVLLVANVPYIPTGEITLLPPEARLHEPLAALDGGADGLDVVRRVSAAAPPWLAPGGHLLIETSGRQAPQAAATFANCGLMPRAASSAELSASVVIGTRAASPAAPGAG